MFHHHAFFQQSYFCDYLSWFIELHFALEKTLIEPEKIAITK